MFTDIISTTKHATRFSIPMLTHFTSATKHATRFSIPMLTAVTNSTVGLLPTMGTLLPLSTPLASLDIRSLSLPDYVFEH